MMSLLASRKGCGMSEGSEEDGREVIIASARLLDHQAKINDNLLAN